MFVAVVEVAVFSVVVALVVVVLVVYVHVGGEEPTTFHACCTKRAAVATASPCRY